MSNKDNFVCICNIEQLISKVSEILSEIRHVADSVNTTGLFDIQRL